MESTVQKSCTVCGVDCSNKPRTKDTQGRYVCKECLQRAQAAHRAKQDAGERKGTIASGAASGAAVSHDHGDNAFILDIVEPPKFREGQMPCPSCGKGIKDGQVLCTSCGFNVKTGERALVNVLQPVEIRDKSERNKGGGGFTLNIHPAVFGVIPLLVLGVMLFATFSMQNEVLLGATIVGIVGYLVISWLIMIVDAFRSGEGGWGVGLLAIPLLPVVTAFLGTRIRIFGAASVIGVVYWLYVECENAAVKWMVCSSLLLVFSLFAMMYANMEWLDTLRAE